MNFKKLQLTLITFCFCLTAYSQSENDEVLKPVYSLFLAMETNDSTLARNVFYPGAQLSTVTKDENGGTTLRTGSIDKLVTAFGRSKEKTWSEPIWNPKVQIDGDLAQVWVDYAFYLGKDFSHCGVDAFQLINTPGGWKIFQLADSRRKDDCIIPEEISAAYK